jgi:hypothetical protein
VFERFATTPRLRWTDRRRYWLVPKPAGFGVSCGPQPPASSWRAAPIGRAKVIRAAEPASGCGRSSWSGRARRTGFVCEQREGAKNGSEPSEDKAVVEFHWDGCGGGCGGCGGCGDSAQDHPGRHARNPPCSIRGVDYPAFGCGDALGDAAADSSAAARRATAASSAGTKPVVIDGVSYRALPTAAALGLSYWAARYIAKSGTLPRRPQRRRCEAGAEARSAAAAQCHQDHSPRRDDSRMLDLDPPASAIQPLRHCEACHLLQRQADLLADLEAELNSLRRSPHCGGGLDFRLRAIGRSGAVRRILAEDGNHEGDMARTGDRGERSDP